ncbi:MAG: hypothetical protein HY864_14065 [Chloroflexi bacterium]|nr:hypothetical protein [Chloroflexota bacterium]
MSRFAIWSSFLDSAQRIIVPGEIQVVKRSASRLPHFAEAMALTVSALGALDRHTGVQTLNLDLDGSPVVLAIIKDASFSQDAQGVTELIKVETRKPK